MSVKQHVRTKGGRSIASPVADLGTGAAVYCAVADDTVSCSGGFVEAILDIELTERSTIAFRIHWATANDPTGELTFHDYHITNPEELPVVSNPFPPNAGTARCISSAITRDPGIVTFSASMFCNVPFDYGLIQILAIVGVDTGDDCVSFTSGCG